MRPALRTTTSLRLVAALAMLLCIGRAAPAAEPMPGAEDSLQERSAIVDAACRAAQVRCVSTCPRTAPARAAPPSYSAAGVFVGPFGGAGRRDALVSLAPCGLPLDQARDQGLFVALEVSSEHWRPMAGDRTVVARERECQTSEAEGRALLLCHRTWEAHPGLTIETLCATLLVRGELRTACPLRLSRASEATTAGLVDLAVVSSASQPLALEVHVGERALQFSVSERGVALAPATAASLDDEPLLGVQIEQAQWPSGPPRR